MASSSERYWVDWEDKYFPEIRPAVEIPAGVRPKTFLQCKAEITQHFTEQLAHDKFMLKKIKELRIKDVR